MTHDLCRTEWLHQSEIFNQPGLHGLKCNLAVVEMATKWRKQTMAKTSWKHRHTVHKTRNTLRHLRYNYSRYKTIYV